MVGFIIIGIMLLCDCSAKAIGIFCIAYGVVVGFVKVMVNKAIRR